MVLLEVNFYISSQVNMIEKYYQRIKNKFFPKFMCGILHLYVTMFPCNECAYDDLAQFFSTQGDIAREALKRLAAAASVKGALQGHELRGMALRLANHGELTRGLVNNLITLGLGREAAFAAAVFGGNALMEKAWQDTGMLAEVVLHAHV
ncbi:hypothetical protein PIB30_064186 [Stylosanthes scabra]|uniref:Uncharacterized protein n=1 Tax=Stylosanthes scabra TaxID=79078 RepID=A0ABU6RLQ3_9FABA|nr:hypothetical protein [Stylosanthes scabra]